MGKNKNKQKQKSALKVASEVPSKPKLTDLRSNENKVDPKFLRKIHKKKVDKAIKSNFQQQVVALQERNYRTVQFSKKSTGGGQVGSNPSSHKPAEFKIAEATFVAPSSVPNVENIFATTDSLFLAEHQIGHEFPIVSESNAIVNNRKPSIHSNNHFQGLEDDDEKPRNTIIISGPTFSFRSSIPAIQDSDI